jgi:tetratricopeptide (TPR) repeat protein
MEDRKMNRPEMAGIYLMPISFFSVCKSKIELMKGFILHRQGKNEEAIEALEKATEVDPHNISAWKFKGVILSRYLRRYIESVEALDRSLQINPKDTDAWDLKGVILARYLNKYEEAIEAFDRSILLDPKNPEVWDLRSEALKAKSSLANRRLTEGFRDSNPSGYRSGGA